ncbi:MAG TPA: DUF6387 family protein [Methylotenera sp.]|nr:DUF6387 family protein [Methylotenera sp.]HPH06255.1 DUF6387 family protein [Methylotenera sp.]HPN02287.1 DUF6387 family protein [Methylotenera sp.]
MSKSTTNINVVKSWFKNSSYVAASKFSSVEWADQIAKRVFIDTDLKRLNEPSRYSQLTVNEKTRLENAMHELMLTPLASFNAGYRNEPSTLKSTTYSTKTVLPLTMPYVHRLNLLFEDTNKDHVDFIDEWANDNPQLGISAFGHIRVDLNARDEDIFADFSKWLINFRKSKNYPPLKAHPKKLESRFFDWHTNKILQYFDVTAWCYWTGTELTNELLLELLFAGYELSKLKTVRLKVTELIDYRNVIALYNES